MIRKPSSTFVSGATQGAELGLVLLNIVIKVLFLFVEVKVASTSDEKTI